MSNFDTVFSTAPKWVNIEDISSANNTAINALHLGAEMQKKAFDSFAGAGNQVFDKAQKQQALEIQKAIDALSVNELANTAKTQADIDKLVLDKFQDIGGASAQTQADIYKALSNAYPERVKQEDAVTTLKTNQLAYKQKKQDNVYKQHGTPAIQQYQQLRSISDLLIATEAKLADPNLTDEGKQKLTAQLQQATAAQTILEESFNQTISNMGEYGEAFVLNIDEHVGNYNRQKEEEKLKNKDLIIKTYTPWAKEKAYSMYGSFKQALLTEGKAEQQKQISALIDQISDVPKEVQDMVFGNVYRILQDEGRHEQAVQLEGLKIKAQEESLKEKRRQFDINAGFKAQEVDNDTARTEAEVANKVSQIEHRDSGGDGNGGSAGDGKEGKGRPHYVVKDPQSKQPVINPAKLAQDVNNKITRILYGSDAYQDLFKTNDGGTISTTDFHKQNKERLNEEQQKLYEKLKLALNKPEYKLNESMKLHILHNFVADTGSPIHDTKIIGDLTMSWSPWETGQLDRLVDTYTKKSKKQLAENKKQLIQTTLNEYIDTFTKYGYSPETVRKVLAEGGIDNKVLLEIMPFMAKEQVKFFSVKKSQGSGGKGNSTNGKAAQLDEKLKSFNSTGGKL